jgi:hypothetical protein
LGEISNVERENLIRTANSIHDPENRKGDFDDSRPKHAFEGRQDGGTRQPLNSLL